jgi:hypothetical protein
MRVDRLKKEHIAGAPKTSNFYGVYKQGGGPSWKTELLTFRDWAVCHQLFLHVRLGSYWPWMVRLGCYFLQALEAVSQ